MAWIRILILILIYNPHIARLLVTSHLTFKKFASLGIWNQLRSRGVLILSIAGRCNIITQLLVKHNVCRRSLPFTVYSPQNYNNLPLKKMLVGSDYFLFEMVPFQVTFVHVFCGGGIIFHKYV